MQVLLIQPWVEDFYTTDCRIQPIGLAYLAGAIRQTYSDVDVNIFDALSGGMKKTIPWPKEFKYLKPYYGNVDKGPFRLFHPYYRFGKSVEEIKNVLGTYTPDLIGISCLFTPYYRESLAMANLCKQLFPQVPIVMGGNHATLHPETLLQARSSLNSEILCDYVIRGEGEEAICELINFLKGNGLELKHPNIISAISLPPNSSQILLWKKKLPEPNIPDRMNIAPPYFKGLNPDDYHYSGQPMTFLITSRSCPHRCSFCSIHAVFGTRYTMRNPEEVVSEILDRYHQGVRHFDIEDDNFTFSRPGALQILNSLIDLNLPIKLSAMNGISYLSLDRELMASMFQAGFESLNLALVSSDLMVRKFTQRPHTLQKFYQVVDDAIDLGFRLTIYSIFGMPGQTVPEMFETLMTLAATQCLVGASPFYFTPGSPIHKKEANNPGIKLASKGKDPYFSSRLTAMDLENDQFDRTDIFTLFKLTRVINYIKDGLDQSYPKDHPYFIPAFKIFKTGIWSAENRSKLSPLPFSKKVHDLFQGRDFMICGYKTNQQIHFSLNQTEFNGL